MSRSIASFEELVEELQAKGVREVTMSGKVATVTSPKGGEITFRGRVVVGADLGSGDQVEYAEEVAPYVTSTGAPDLSVSAEAETQLRQAQLALMEQLRAYRGEYQGLMDSARAALAARLEGVGIRVREPEGY